ncbi:hypothetical protein N0V83_003560 [Neocucurbitaria cava]|uniref:Beta-lactamase-related domain-containing protein n=1 Tax=Neocucurbitaria cava TaxID=798079 RepID=A0A9W8YDF9_9PLEO|nr:hypothetical protein N0V83_003560 [Neocucurbitaria cava]
MAHKTIEFEQLVARLMEEWKVPGLSIAVVQGDEMFAKSFGQANLEGDKCTEDTLFDLASTSKATTAAAVACLVDDEAYPDVQWTTPVSKLLSEDFVLSDPEYTKNVTIEDILSHRTGLPGHDNSYLSVRTKHADNARSITRNLRNLPLNKPLRTTYQYSNIMYTVATHLVETISGISYADFLRSKIWDPLGMQHTYHDHPNIPSAAKEHLATGHRWDAEKESYIRIGSYPSPEGQGAGSIFSTTSSYAKFIRALLTGSAPLSSTAQKELVTPRTIIPSREDWTIPYYSHSLYALGCIVESYQGHTVIGHDGDVSGFKALVRWMPEFQWGVVMLGNSEGAFYAEQVLFHGLMDGVVRGASTSPSGLEKADVDWVAFWREWAEREKEEERAERREEDEERFRVTEGGEKEGAGGLPVETLVGRYFNAGYKGLVLEEWEGKLIADGHDRSFPLLLTFTHLQGKRFVVEVEDLWAGKTRKVGAEFRIGEGGKVEALGVEFVEEMEGYLVWFDRVA